MKDLFKEATDAVKRLSEAIDRLKNSGSFARRSRSSIAYRHGIRSAEDLKPIEDSELRYLYEEMLDQVRADALAEADAKGAGDAAAASEALAHHNSIARALGELIRRRGEVQIGVIRAQDGTQISLEGMQQDEKGEIRQVGVRVLRGGKAETKFFQAAQPAAEAGPIVGGVTEDMLDEMSTHIPKAFAGLAEGLFERARAAIRAQKRVNVDMLRKLAESFAKDGLIARASLMRRAIGDEPAEAPVAEAPEPPATPQETAQGGPFVKEFDWTYIHTNWSGETGAVICRKDAYAFHVKQFYGEMTKDRLVRLLNAGLEAERLRARVAELEAHVNSYAQSYQDEKARADAAEKRVAELDLIRAELVKLFGWTDTSALHASLHIANAVNNLRADIATEKARADAAEKRVAELEASCSHRTYFRERDRADAAEAKLRDREDSITALEAKLARTERNAAHDSQRCATIWGTCSKAVGGLGPETPNAEDAVAVVIQRMKDAEAKLAALKAQQAQEGS